MSKNPRITSQEVGIIKKAQAGDKSAFNTLFYKYKPFVENILTGYIKDKDEAKDLTNIVFLKVYEKLSTFKAYDSFGGWLRIIANRTAIDYLRETKNKQLDLEPFAGRLPSESSCVQSEDDLVNRLTYEQLLCEFDKLSETNRKVCRLFYKNNMTVEQIGDALQIPTGTIKSTLSRTRKRIQKQLKI